MSRLYCLLDVLDDRLVHLVAGDAHRLAVDDAGERDDGDVGRAAADVDDHVAGRLGDRHAGADRRRHRFLDQVHFAGLGAVGAVFHRALLDLRDLRRHADDDARPHPDVAVVRLLDEVGQHLLGDLEVGDDAVLHRLDGDDVAGRAAEHVLGVLADGLDPAVHLVDGHDRRLVDDDALAAGVDAGVGGAEVDGQVTRKQRKHRTKTQRRLLTGRLTQGAASPGECTPASRGRRAHLCQARVPADALHPPGAGPCDPGHLLLSPVKVLVLGSGAREHALVRAPCSPTPASTAVHAAPGNAGIAADAECDPPSDLADAAAVAELAVDLGADLVVVGPEAPLVAGVADAVRAAGIACFGPSAAAAQLEGSKAFAKDVMAAAGVPTARARVCATAAEVAAALDDLGAPYVVKDDGLAAGKGVVVTEDRAEAAGRRRAPGPGRSWSRSTWPAPRCRCSP